LSQEQGKISEVAVTDNVIQGLMLTENSDSGRGERFQTVRVDAEVSEVLDQNGIEYKGHNKCSSGKISATKNLDVDTLAGMTPGMLGADLANLVNEAALLSVMRKKAEVGMAEFEEAVDM
jgi:ATP-dependent Zn protease